MGFLSINKEKKLYQQALVKANEVIDALNNGIYTAPKVSFSAKAYRRMLVNKDMILCANRFVWNNLPTNLTSQELECMFYKYGALCFFVEKGQLLVGHFAMKGTLNPYGKLIEIIPIDFGGVSYSPRKAVIGRYGFDVPEGENVAVIIKDYSYLETEEESRYNINVNATIQDQIDTYQQLKTNIALSVKKALAICDNEEQKNAVMNEVEALLNPSLPVVAISTNKGTTPKGNLPVDMFNFGNTFDTQNYCQTLDYYDKIRRSFNGIPAPDTFEKKERKITSEAEDTSTHTNIVLQDGLKSREDGLELIKRYLQCEGIEQVTVELNPILIDKVERAEPREEDDEDESISND